VYHSPDGTTSTLINTGNTYFTNSVINKVQTNTNAINMHIFWDGGNLWMI